MTFMSKIHDEFVRRYIRLHVLYVYLCQNVKSCVFDAFAIRSINKMKISNDTPWEDIDIRTKKRHETKRSQKEKSKLKQ